MRIALIKNGIVDNIAEFDDFPTAVTVAGMLEVLPIPTDDLPVGIGDEYRDGEFYREDELVTVPEAEEAT